MSQILEYLGNSHAEYIHAKGRQSTDKFIELLKPQDHEKILEIGFGTGATLVQTATKSKAKLFGYEVSPIMYRKASKRIRFCNLSEKINVRLLDQKNSFPADNNSFNKVYAESILAIQEGDGLKNLLLEIKRVLKPGGILLFNETIWLESITKNKAKHINKECKKSFGIIQSNDEYLHVSDWKRLLLSIGFEPELEIRVDELPPTKQKMSWVLLLSKSFTLIGKIRTYASISKRREWRQITRNMDAIKNNENLMEGRIIKAYKRA